MVGECLYTPSEAPAPAPTSCTLPFCVLILERTPMTIPYDTQYSILQRLSLLFSWFLHPMLQQSLKISFNVGVVTFEVREKLLSPEVTTHPLTCDNRGISIAVSWHVSVIACVYTFSLSFHLKFLLQLQKGPAPYLAKQ